MAARDEAGLSCLSYVPDFKVTMEAFNGEGPAFKSLCELCVQTTERDLWHATFVSVAPHDFETKDANLSLKRHR